MASLSATISELLLGDLLELKCLLVVSGGSEGAQESSEGA